MKVLKYFLITLLTIVLIGAAVLGLYLKILPKAINHKRVINYLENIASDAIGSETRIKNLSIQTSFSPNINIKAEEISFIKDNQPFFEVKNIDTDISFKSIFNKNIFIKKIYAQNLSADINKLLALPAFSQKSQNKSPWEIDIFKTEMDIKKANIFYQIDKDYSVNVNAKDLVISQNPKNKYISYDINATLHRQNHDFKILTRETGENTYIKNKKQLVIKNSKILANNTKILLNGIINFDGKYNLNFKGNNFTVTDTIDILNTQIVSNNFADYLVYFKDINGNYNFNVDFDQKGVNGEVKLNKLSFNFIPLENIPILLNKGDVKFNNDKIILKNFKGFYNNKPANKMDFEGSVKDYLKSVDTDLVGNAVVTDDFARNFLSKLISYPVGITGIADTRVMIKSKNNKFDITWLYMFKKGTGFIVDGEEMELNRIAHRILVAKMHFENMLLKINSIDYHLAHPNGKRNKEHKPIISMHGNIDFGNNKQFVKDFGLTLTRPMPSAFVNLLLKENIFKGGTFTGKMELDNNGKYPILEGDLQANNVSIPSQQLTVNSGQFKTDKDNLYIKTTGTYRQSYFDIDAVADNKITFPIIIKDANLNIDEVNVEKYLQAFNEQKSSGQAEEDIHSALSKTANSEPFNLANIIVEKCKVNIKKGFYKGINFANVVANLAMDKNSILTMRSNRFDIAEGHAEAKSDCDLKNHKYNLSLAVMGVNSDIIATELVNLPREINGKASGIMELNTDETLRLNGTMKFVVQNGVIAKMGLVEYTMKVAALFRNPIVMVTPAVISDLTEVPEGKFERINGELKLENNVIRRLVIKSVSPQLSTFIVGRYNLHNQDAILRIYTKFSNKKKGAFGFLRSISLNSLANRIPLSSRNNSNYYAAEIAEIPKIEADEKDTQIFLTTVDGDIVDNNFLSALKKIK